MTVAQKPALVTLDAAQTLVWSHFEFGRFALDCAHEAGLEPPEGSADRYRTMVRSRWPHYQQLNVTRDHDQLDAFWLGLTHDWLEDIGCNPERWSERLCEAGSRLMCDGKSYFAPYDDAVPALAALRATGVKLAVLSNWDYTLHRVLRAVGLHDQFDLVVASLEVGVEKPDARLFRYVLDHFGVASSEAVHVGDNVIDDLLGARNAGLGALLLDRASVDAKPHVVASLTELPERLGWSV